jgi:hypothetical protein
MLLDVGSAPSPTTGFMNYFNYFTEIETRFQRRRGSILMLSPLDWEVIEMWRQAGVPLEAVLRGIDDAFDNRDKQRARLGNRRQRDINGLAWCYKAVIKSIEQFREAAVGTGTAVHSDSAPARESGFEASRIARYLARNAALLDTAATRLAAPADGAATEAAARLRALAAQIRCPTSGSSDVGSQPPPLNLEDLDRILSVLEEKLVAALLTATPEAQLVALREQAARSLAPYRGRMQAVQIKQVQQQFLEKRLLEAHALPRLSLFYMPHDDGDGTTES